MKFYVLTLFFILSLFQIAFSQSFYLSVHDSTANADPEASVELETYIVNTSGAMLAIRVVRVQNNIPDDWNSQMCVGATCYSPGTSEITDAVESWTER